MMVIITIMIKRCHLEWAWHRDELSSVAHGPRYCDAILVRISRYTDHGVPRIFAIGFCDDHRHQPEFFALEWMRANYQNRIAWVCSEIDAIAVSIDRESGMAEEAKQRICKALTDLRLAAVAVLDCNQPIDVLDRAVFNLKDRIRREIAQSRANADILAKIELMLERLKAHVQAVWDLCNPE